MQVEGDIEQIPPSTSCPKVGPHPKPAKYKMKAVREKKKKPSTRRRALHLKHCRRRLVATEGTTVQPKI
jgi:hypothetical protein